MGQIKVLPQDLVSKIAAGEVVERPASVVKELLDNSIDAKANRVTIDIEEGGIKKILMVDDGMGMDQEDALLACTPHATSKLSSADDLLNIKQYGFRGEALSSIAAVSKLTLKTKRGQDQLGTEIKIEGGIVASQSQVGAQSGTSILVEDLFYNVPARKEFVKSAQSEYKAILDVVESHAMANQDVGITLIHNGKTIYAFPKDDKLDDRVRAILGTDFYEKLTTFYFEHPHLEIYGFAGKPELATERRSQQYIFVNKRHISSKSIAAAVKKAYGGLIPNNTYPPYVIFIDVPPNIVDVNVHPRKEEVKFTNESLIFTSVETAIKKSLDRVNLTPGAPNKGGFADPFGGPFGPGAGAGAGGFGPSPFGPGPSPFGGQRPGFGGRPSPFGQAQKPFGTPPPFAPAPMPFDQPAMGAPTPPAAPNTPQDTKTTGSDDTKPTDAKDVPAPDSAADTGAAPKPSDKTKSDSKDKPADSPLDTGVQSPPPLPPTPQPFADPYAQQSFRDSYGPAGRDPYGPSQRGFTDPMWDDPFADPYAQQPFDQPMGQGNGKLLQVHNLYLIVESESGIIVYDQHAAHERILYEEFLKTHQDAKAQGATQGLLTPEVVNFTVQETETFTQYRSELESAGFVFEDFGRNAFKVTQVPAVLADHPLKELLHELIEDLEHDEKTKDADLQSNKMLKYLACRTAYKAGDPIAPEEAQALIDRLAETDIEYTCPHGRPVKVEITLDELAKKFLRK